MRVTFKLLDEDEAIPVVLREIPYHIIFDVKFDLTRKFRLVAGRHRHKDLSSYSKFSTVVARDSIRIGLVLSALNDLGISTTDISNAYLNLINRKNVHVKFGKELFDEAYEGLISMVTRAL